MLVYAKNSNGIIYLNNRPIPGRNTGRDPVDISYQLYETYGNVLEDATIRENYLRQNFGWSQGEIAFTYNELRWLPENTLRKIARGMKLNEASRTTNKQLVEDIKRALRGVV